MKALVADEVWVATAQLHRRHPDRSDFTVGEIVQQAESAQVAGEGEALRPGVKLHAYLYCVADRPPNPGRHRMLFETAKGRRRLFRPGDPWHPGRAGKCIPVDDAIQLACAAAASTDLFITNDERLSRKIVEGIHFIQSLEKAMP